jgi:hypothetical protein
VTLPLELGGIRDPAVRRAFEILAMQFPIAVSSGGGGGPETDPIASAALTTHAADTTGVHGIADTADLIVEGDPRLTDSRTPDAHASTHEPGGTDAMDVDAAAATGSLRTLGAGASQAAAGNDARLSNARTPTAHATTHQPGGGDAMAVDAAAGTGSLRTLGTSATSAAAGNRGMPAGGASGEVLAKNSATDYDASWAAVSGGGGAGGTMTLDTWHTVGGAGEPAFTNSWTNEGAPYHSAAFRKYPNGRVALRGAIQSGTLSTAAFTLPVGYRPPARLTFTASNFITADVAVVDIASTGTVTIHFKNDYVDLSVVSFDTDSVTTLFGWTAIPRQAADVTNATTTPVNTDLVFTFEANSTYVIDLYLLSTAAATTTGFGFAFDTSVVVTVNALTFEHQLAAAGTLTGGDSIADDTVRGLSSGVPVAGALVMSLGKGTIISGANGGTCRLRFRPEVAASATFKAGSVMRVMKAA